MKISNNDIKNRIYKLSESCSYNYNEYIHEEAYRTTKLTAIRESMKAYLGEMLKAEKLEDAQTEFENMLNLYEHVIESCPTPSHEVDVCIYYLNEAVERVRTPKEMQTLLKRRISLGTRQKGSGKLASKMEKISAGGVKPNDISGNIKGNADNLIKKIEVPTLDIKKPNTPTSSSNENCYNNLIDTCQKSIEVDRIITNFNELSRRFNVVKVLDTFTESITGNVDTYCELFDTWTDEQMSKKSKFNVAIETALYINDKYNMGLDRSEIIESIVDYHLFNNTSYDFIYHCLENNSMVTEEDLIPYMEYTNDNNLAYIIENESKNPDKNTKSAIKEFKKSDNKTPEKFKDVIAKAYTKTPDQIINDTPKIFDVFRFFVVIASFSINPILGLITFFSDQFIKRKYSREQCEKMIKKYTNEIDHVNKKIDKCDNEEKKKRLKEYRDKLEDGLYKIKDYESELYSEKEYENIENKRDESSSDNFDEAAMVILLAEQAMNINTVKLEDCIENHIARITETGLIDDITDFIIQSDNFLSLNRIKNIYESHYRDLKRAAKKDYVAIDTVNNNINKISEALYYNTEDDSDETIVENDVRLLLGYNLFNEALMMLDEELSSPFFIETSFNNTFNIIKNKIQDGIKFLTDKEKEIASKIDSAFTSFKSNVESFFKSDAREQVLKGKILPSASNMLKVALPCGIAGVLIHPVVGAIGMLGYLGVHAGTTHKERQVILDEIELELNMVDRYIQKAESKENLKAVRNLLKTKKRLQKERLRIKYKMKMHGERPDTNDFGNHN